MALGSGGLRVGACRFGGAVACVVALAWPLDLCAQTGGLLPGEHPPVPPAPIPNASPPTGPVPLPAPGANMIPPATPAPIAPTPAAPATTPPVASPATPMVPPGQVALALGARFGHDPPSIPGGLVWRVYGEKAD